MDCENNFCIYWEDGTCSLGEISRDIRGMCLDCIYIDLAETLLKKERLRIRRSYEQDYRSWSAPDPKLGFLQKTKSTPKDVQKQ